MYDTDQPEETARSVAGQIETECDRIARIGSLIEAGLERPRSSADLKPMLERALRELVDHERELDSTPGIHRHLMEVVPQLHDQVRLLQTEHGALTREARRLIDACRSCDDPDEIDRLQRGLRHLVTTIERHRKATLQLIEAARATSLQ